MIPRSDSQSRMFVCTPDWQSSALKKIGVSSEPWREVATTCAPAVCNHKYHESHRLLSNQHYCETCYCTSYILSPSEEKFICVHVTIASSNPNWSRQTVPQALLMQTSTRPSRTLGPSCRRTSPVWQLPTGVERAVFIIFITMVH